MKIRLGLLILMIQPLQAMSAPKIHSKDGFIQLTEFGTTPVDIQALNQSIRALLGNAETCKTDPAHCVNDQDVANLQSQALQFRKFMQETVNAQLVSPTGGKIPYHDEWYDDGPFGLASREYHSVSFPSLIQRPNKHPANQVYLTYIVPVRDDSCLCDYKTAIVLAGATEDTIPGIAGLAADISNMNYVATAYLNLPQFGLRRILPQGKLDPVGSKTAYDPDEFDVDFLNINDKNLTELNLQQSMLDIHLTIDWIHSIKRNSGTSTVAMTGFSLGSLVGLLYEGIEPHQLTGGDVFYAPGSDISHAITAYAAAPQYAQDYFRRVIETLHWDADLNRKIWGEFDSLTWAGQIKNRKILLLNASQDEIFVRSYSFDPMYAILAPNNTLDSRWIKSSHNPSDSGLLTEAFGIFFPLMDYLRFQGVSSDPDGCGGTTP